MTAGTAALAAFCAEVPVRPRWERAVPLVPVSLWIGLFEAGCLSAWSLADPQALVFQSDWACLPGIVMVGLVPGIAMAVMLRRGAPLAPMLSVGLGGLAAAALADFGLLRRSVLIMVVAVAATSAAAAPVSAMEAMRPIGEVLASGRVVKVDIDAARITIEHRPIWRFYLMEAATRIFKVRDAAMLTGFTPGDWIRFKLERAEGGFVVTWIENANW